MKTNKITTKILHYLGFNTLARIFLKHKIYVLNYHSVSSSDTNSEFSADLYTNLSIEKDRFESHIKFLKNKGHTFINFYNLLNLDLKNINKPTIIYFDDGFKDNLKNALPILKKYGVKATVFVSTDIADGNSTLWTIKHRAYLEYAGVDEEKWANEINELKRMNKEERDMQLEREYKKIGFEWSNKNASIFLNWEDIIELSKNGVEIGSHSMSHYSLLEIDEELLIKELKESKKKIESGIGSSVNSFSYPYGRWNNNINKILKEVGYKVAVSIGRGLNNIKDISNGFVVLKTIPIKIDDDVIDLEAKLYMRHFLRK